MKRTPEEIEHDFDEMIDIRLDARNHSNYSVIEKTQADWEKIKKEYLESVYSKTPLSEDEKEVIKKAFKDIPSR